MPLMPRARRILAAPLVLALAFAACSDSGPASFPRVAIDPILDSLYVGDTLPTRAVQYFDASGMAQPTGPVRWGTSDTAVFTVDSVTGVVVGTGRGVALLSARANATVGTALLVVTRTLDVSLLLDTLYLMPGDTITIRPAVRVKTGGPATVRFRMALNATHTLDSVTGKDSAMAPGAAQPFVVVAALGPDTVADTGAAETVQLIDTVGGKGFFTVLGVAIRRARSGARAVNYRRLGDTATFRVSLPIVVQSVTVENVVVTLRDSVGVTGTFGVDSISLQEASGPAFICQPKRAWALWSTNVFGPTLRALSRPGGTITITSIGSVLHGKAIGGRFEFTGQRTDLYDDPLGALPIRGTFVAPLITDVRPCGS